MLHAKDLYHRLIPDRVRYPIGRLRRGAIDRWVRWRTAGPALPPRAMLRSVQMTPWIWEYLQVGEVAAGSVRAAFEDACLASTRDTADGGAPRVLDFGCGLGRTLRFLLDTCWHLEGCDVDARSVEWSRTAFPQIRFEVNAPEPPLPYPSSTFDGLFAVSVFTHFDAPQQSAWAAEVARVLRAGGLALITTMGVHALGGFPNLHSDDNRRTLEEAGFFVDEGGEDFNSRGAFHTRAGIEDIFGDGFEVLSHRPGGVDGFQDLSVLRRCG